MNNLSDLNNPEAAKEDRGYASADDAAPKPFARAKLKREKLERPRSENYKKSISMDSGRAQAIPYWIGKASERRLERNLSQLCHDSHTLSSR
ncbi:hypothetical protein SASPL_131154 [Salvia splendens]|uniref:Uncharacterized protein n=1 Tax=Salvia splendens TaxID=180675 RepID=A0A8X8XAF4_SALSN|nr:hypothetical protein SASPL_131154 [Salvia splendens]